MHERILNQLLHLRKSERKERRIIIINKKLVGIDQVPVYSSGKDI